MTTRRIPVNSTKEPIIKATAFQTVTFYDPKEQRQILLLYSLGEDGIIREFINGKWMPFPIPAKEP